MNIVYATETFLPSVDGVVTRMRHALDWLAAHGHSVTVLAPDLGCNSYGPFPVLGVPALTYPIYRTRPWGRPSGIISRALRRIKPDIVHAWHPAIIGAQAVQATRRQSIPLITSYHTNIDRYLACYGALSVFQRPVMRYMRWLNNTSPLTLVPSDNMQSYLAAQGFAGLRVLPRGVDLQQLGPEHASARMRSRLSGGDPAAPLLLYVGRLGHEKNLASLLPLMKAHPEWALALVGDGPARSSLERAFAGTRTTFTGFLAGAELSQAYASADCFIFPSLTETLGLVILEAMASGTAVVAADSPASREQINHGVTGLLYRADDPAAAARALADVLAQPALRQQLADAGRACAQAHGWEAASASFIDFYQESLELYRSGWRPPRHPSQPVPDDGVPACGSDPDGWRNAR